MRLTAVITIAFGIGLAVGTASRPRTLPESEPDVPAGLFTDETSVAWVLVPVTVQDERGGFVTDLAARNFRLRVDGRATRFDSFDADAAAPVSLIHLQDLSGSMAVGGKLEAARSALDCFLTGLRPIDEIAVASFGAGQLGVDVPFTSVAAAARESAAGWRPYGTTALHDAVAWLPEIGLEGRWPRRAAVLLTDGADNASSLAAEAARDMVRRARLPVYVLALDTPVQGRARPEDAALMSNRALLEALAAETGGRFFDARVSFEDAAAACRAITTELRHQYVLGFKVAANEPTAFHRLEVQVAYARTVVITHRASYRGGSP